MWDLFEILFNDFVFESKINLVRGIWGFVKYIFVLLEVSKFI